jgi:hypothetical protein
MKKVSKIVGIILMLVIIAVGFASCMCMDCLGGGGCMREDCVDGYTTDIYGKKTDKLCDWCECTAKCPGCKGSGLPF